jgi:hypothetical protein
MYLGMILEDCLGHYLRRMSKMTKIGTKMNIFLDENENHPLYLKYQRLLDQYFEIVDDDEKRQRKFIEAANESRKLEQLGISLTKEMIN